MFSSSLKVGIMTDIMGKKTPVHCICLLIIRVMFNQIT
jgi:hypothetical protein